MSAVVKGKPTCSRGENTAPSAVPAGHPTVCRCCGGHLDAQWQAAYRPEKPGFWLLTCWNKTCGLYAVTRSDVTYSTFDLQPYLVKE